MEEKDPLKTISGYQSITKRKEYAMKKSRPQS